MGFFGFAAALNARRLNAADNEPSVEILDNLEGHVGIGYFTVSGKGG
jgi:hypothetical protein